MKLGTPRLHMRQTGSTNDDAKRLAAAGAPAGLLVTASAQTAGRGRRGRSWTAPPGQALLMSLVLDATPLLPLRTAVALARACGPRATIKWPNDIQVDGLKVAGILCEAQVGSGQHSISHVVVGIGVNVALQTEALPPELAGIAGSMGREPHEIEDFLAQLLRELEVALATGDHDLLDQWRERDALLGQHVAWHAGAGIADGIDESGRLLVRIDDGSTMALDAGEVTLAQAG